jgi:hypothetical protein
MSGPNAALSLPLEDRPAALQPEPAPPQEVKAEAPWSRPGLILAVNAIGNILDEAMMAFADLKLALEQDNLAALEAHLEKIAALATHARKTVTSARVRERRE